MESNKIQGNPTKAFFIGMITRDISIRDAIIDLLDNSIDGAIQINPQNFSGLNIYLTINENEFIVKDNCGGFSLETAQKYAFRFGRPEGAPETIGSVGRFGVGMKRALFKIGQCFEVESKTTNDHFQINVDVENWKNKKKNIRDEEGIISEEDDWSFDYENITDASSDLIENGTYIRVVKLNEDVSSIFKEQSFLNDLKNDIERLLNFSIEKGIKIFLNGEPIEKKGIFLFKGLSTPYFYEFESNGVNVRIIAGLSSVGEPRSSGWYIYCNDRLVLEHDQTEITGWGVSLPQWHIDYVMFKGVVFMDSKETFKLPLTTTKKGIDATSDIYKKALYFMKEAMTSIFAFLKQVRKLEDANDYRKLLGDQETKVTVQMLKIDSFSVSRSFKSPDIDFDKIAIKQDTVRISFNVPRETAELAKTHSNCKNYKEFGEYIYEYYLKMEEISHE
ncbi:MAG: ATP-binding protein [Salinivirgaceae bacterium]|jgi:hypothetical protein